MMSARIRKLFEEALGLTEERERQRDGGAQHHGLTLEGLEGADFSRRAGTPNLGILSLRFPVSDLKALRAFLLERQIPLLADPVRVELPPYGMVEVMAIRAPEGARLEFYAQP